MQPEWRTRFVEECLTPRPGWDCQRFEYYAAHYIVGAGLAAGGDVEKNIRSLAAVLQKQYDVGVVHGMRTVRAVAG